MVIEDENQNKPITSFDDAAEALQARAIFILATARFWQSVKS
jgi:hypothetical protein